jgi:hypothetical protein
MKENYFKSVVMIERLHRLFLEVVKVELDRTKIRDINNVQCLVLYNMVQNGYLVQEPSPHDRRSSHVKLSTKGLSLHDKLDDLFTMHAKALADDGVDDHAVAKLDETLTQLEGFWTSLLTRDLRR